MEAVCYSESSVKCYQIVWRYIPEENLRSNTSFIFSVKLPLQNKCERKVELGDAFPLSVRGREGAEYRFYRTSYEESQPEEYSPKTRNETCGK
jgi:hypothetical protein